MLVERIEESGKGKMKVYLDDGRSFTVYRKEVRGQNLEPGAEVTDGQLSEIYSGILIPRARKRAMHLLEQMDRTEAQLREKLRQNAYPDDIAEDAVAYVKKFHYIDDRRYALNYIRYRSQNQSRRQLSQALLRKGVSREIIEEALSEEYGQEDETGKIHRWLEKKHYDPAVASLKDRQRIYQFLLRKGFRSEDILRVLS